MLSDLQKVAAWQTLVHLECVMGSGRVKGMGRMRRGYIGIQTDAVRREIETDAQNSLYHVAMLERLDYIVYLLEMLADVEHQAPPEAEINSKGQEAGSHSRASDSIGGEVSTSEAEARAAP